MIAESFVIGLIEIGPNQLINAFGLEGQVEIEAIDDTRSRVSPVGEVDPFLWHNFSEAMKAVEI